MPNCRWRVTLCLLLCSLLFPLNSIRAQSPDSSSHKMSPGLALFLLEFVGTGMAAMSMPSFGDESFGAITGITGLGFIPLTRFQELQTAIPYSAGMLGISYYNFKFGDRHSAKRKFLNNFMFLNGTFAATILSAYVFRPRQPQAEQKFDLNFSPSRFLFSIRF